MFSRTSVRLLARSYPFAPFALGLLLIGCGPTVSSHVVDVVVDYEGVVTRAVLEFADHDEEIEGRDDSCGLFTGNCGTFTSVRATVSGNATPLSARLETHGDGSSRTYDLAIERDPEEAASERPATGPVRCRIYHFTDRPELSDFGEPKTCYNTTRNVTVTLTFRDGDDGS